MQNESIVEREPVAVMYVAGERSRPIPEQAAGAFEALESDLASFKGRRFYGAVVDGEYRACVAVEPRDEGLPLARWTLPGGRYRRIRIADWEAHRDEIGTVVAELRARCDSDPGRPVIEYYRSQRELQVLGPVA